MRKKVTRKTGLNDKKRIDWSLPENMLACVLSQHGLHAKTIYKYTGIKPSAIYYRNKKKGIRIKDYRDGKGVVVQRILTEYNIRSIGEKASGLELE